MTDTHTMITRRDFTTSLAFTLGGSAMLRAATAAAAKPSEILLIRHGEEDKRPDEHLNAAGRQRANALAKMFPSQFATPGFLFAAQNSKASHRSMETIAPLAAALGLTVDARFDDDRYRPLAQEILTKAKYANARILICWHHGRLPALAAALGATNAPAVWPGAQFDHVWRLQYTERGVTFTDLAQRLAP